jgi:hypothetical protein
MPAIEPDDARRFGLRPPPPFVDFIRVRSAPVMWMRNRDFAALRRRRLVSLGHSPLCFRILGCPWIFSCSSFVAVYKKKFRSPNVLEL